MNSHSPKNAVATLLLAGTALLTFQAATFAASTEGGGRQLLAQAAPPEEKDKKPGPPGAKPPGPPPQRPAAPPPRPPTEPAPPPPHPAAPSAPPPHPAAPPPPHPPAAQPAPPSQQPRPAAPPPAPPPQAVPSPRPQGQERREERRGSPPPPGAGQPAPQALPSHQPPALPPAAAPAPQPPAAAPPAPARQPAAPPPPAAQQQFQRGPGQPQNAQPGPNFRTNHPAAAVAAPTQPRDAREFIRRDGSAPAPRLEQLRQQRQETHEGNTTFIREGDRTIIREGNTAIIRHSEANRFAIGARNVQTERRGNNSETIVELGNGVRIVNETDPEGRLLRRYRRDPSGREIIIIDNAPLYRRGTVPLFLQLAPPVVRIPRERYILDADSASLADIYGVLEEPPVEVIDQPYTLDQVRYNAPLRDRMPRVDLDLNFDTGSWQITPDQIDRLSMIADAINRMLQRNPREVFMIEGYTDATGTPEDNLSLSDRRAESVAVALTEQFQVPPENLVTQGYGEQFLKVRTDAPERLNRRVAVRRITPLIDQQAQNAPPPPR